ncbi:MAG: Trigger factor [Verrucomicrobiales bacterium]|nr:Trigger factor [Verrucomicrobiales bacterium]
MNVTVENLGPCKKLLRLEVDAAKVDATFAEVTKQYVREARLPGFRPGKAPKEMVTKRFEKDIREEVKQKLTRETYQGAIREKKIGVVRTEDIEEVLFEKGQAYQFIVTVESAPDFDLPEYKGLAIKREAAIVTDADVTKALNTLRERQAKYETAARELREGDVAVVNYTGTCEGKPLTDFSPAAKGLTKKENFWVDANKGSFIPGFTDQLLGAKAGDKRTVNVDFPADFVTPQVAGKKGVYEVELVEVKEKILPELNEEFAKSFEVESLDKLREAVQQDLQMQVNEKQQRGMREQAVRAVLDPIKCELPDSAVQTETRNLIYNMVNDNTQRGVPKEMIDANKDQIYASANTVAKDRVKAGFVFRKIAEKEGIRVDEQALMQRVQMMAQQYQTPVDKLVKDLQKNDGFGEIQEQILNERVVDFLIQNAKVEDVAAQPEPSA